MDQIIIENLRVYAHHGVYREENEKGQNFYITAVMETDTRNAGTLDDLDLSTNYGEVCMFMNDFVAEHTYKLIETVAEKTAEAVLLKFPLIRRVTLEIRKPEAPIPLPFESVSVKIVRGWHRAYLSCGSNMGDRKAHLDGAVEALRENNMCHVIKCSDWIVTAPYGGVVQEDFLNGVIALDTLYTPAMLLQKLHEIEYAHDRERKIHWGPRTLDLDILLYEDCVMHTEELTIPHADMHNRYFVLKPLAQIAPYERHPVLGSSIEQMYEELVNDAGKACVKEKEGKMCDMGIENRETDDNKVTYVMENVHIEHLTLEQAREIYGTYAQSDFPPEELKPFSVIEETWGRGNYHAYGFYEGTTLCAYAFLMADVEKRLLLLDYFAVVGERRGQGYGSRALALLREGCAEWNALVIEVEDDELPDINEETRDMRKRRISFYTAAGCLMSTTRSRLWGVDYRIMVMPLTDQHAPRCMAEKLHAIYNNLYHEDVLRQHFAITAR
ncbi:MAG: 2-amino-4-hydroxy-6-hydroxymethyldihydropteridine diphosphokinase [Lachnospiraceae bacterium]|nr:2-amino-4-hydroxy-6-hydroxymethyldihydropteridine diphosphokinase [Lachnospiraceae bacterium]